MSHAHRNERSWHTLAVLAATTLLLLTPLRANEPPEVVTVPMEPTDLTQAHPAWPGLSVVLKGTASDPDGPGPWSYTWTWGDGTGSLSGATPNLYIIEYSHVYACTVLGDRYVATLEVCDDAGACGTDSYLVECVDPDERDERGFQVNRINRAIDEGLWYLHKRMTRYTTGDPAPAGYIYAGSYTPAYTAAAVDAFEGKNSYPEPRGDRSENPYVEDVERGINYLLTRLYRRNVGAAQTCAHDANGNGYMLGSSDRNRMYQDPMLLQALVTSQVPDKIAETGRTDGVKGRRYRDIAADIADFLVYAQNDSWRGHHRGGWRYYENYGNSDNSVTQWPILGLEAAEFFFEIPVPACVKSELGGWLDRTQCGNGGYGYAYANSWCNTNKTGAGMAGLALIDRPDTHGDWEAAESFLGNRWNYSGWVNCDYQNLYAYYAVMKALVIQQHNMTEVTGSQYEINCIRPEAGDPDSCLPGRSGVGINWYKSYSDLLVSRQYSNGAWPGHCWFNQDLSTAWAVLILERAVTCHLASADAGASFTNVAPGDTVTLDGCSSSAPAKYDPDDPEFDVLSYLWDFDDADGADCRDEACASDDWHECHDCSLEDPCVCTATFVPPTYYIDDDPANDIDWARTARLYNVSLCIETENREGCATGDRDFATVEVTPPPYAPRAHMPSDRNIGCEDCVLLDVAASHHPAYDLYCVDDPDHPYCDWIVSWRFDLDGDGAYDDGYCEDRDSPADDEYDWCYWDLDGDGVMDNEGRHIEWCNCDYNNCEKDQSIVRMEVCDAKASPDPNISDCDTDNMIINAAGQPPECGDFVDPATGEPVDLYYCDESGNTMQGTAAESCPGEVLEYRWDFECDGTWDTAWSAASDATHTYPDCETQRFACFQARVTDAPAQQCQSSVLIEPCQPPLADARAAVDEDCAAPGVKNVTLDGSASSDPQGRPLVCEWYEDGLLVSTDCVTTVQRPMGDHVFSLRVLNDCDPPRDDWSDVLFTVSDTVPPTLSLPADPLQECEGDSQAWASPVATCDDACGTTSCSNDWTAGGCDASGNYPVGSTAVGFTCTDESGNSSTGSVNVHVQDTIPPTVDCPSAEDLIGASCMGYRTIPVEMAHAADTCDLSSVVSEPATVDCFQAATCTMTATDVGGNQAACAVEIAVDCPGPSSQGYWHRQCLGVPEAEGGIDPGRNGRGPDSPTEPYFVEHLMPCADARLEELGFYGTDCCEGMNADPANDKCEKALKQLTALVLNECSFRVEGPCTVDAGAQGCSSTSVGDLIDEVATMIHNGSCNQAASCAAAVNEGDALADDGAGAGTGEAGDESTLEPQPPVDPGPGRRRPIRTRPGVPVDIEQRIDRPGAEPAADRGGSLLRDDLDRRLRSARRLVLSPDEASRAGLLEELEQVRDEARTGGLERLARRADRLIKRLRRSD